MSTFTKTTLSLKYGLASLAILAAGWFLLNIWIVMAGTLAAILSIRKLTLANVPTSLRALLFLTIFAMLVALNLYSHNNDFGLAAGCYLLCGILNPWLRWPSTAVA
jgi:hypothetical protein